MDSFAPPAIVERAAAILRDEIAGGALSNIASSRHIWSKHQPALIATEASRRLLTDLEAFVEPILELIAPAPPIVLRSAPPVRPGETAEIHTRLHNDGPYPVDVDFLCSDLVAHPESRIQAHRIRLQPTRLRVSPGGGAGLTIAVDVPPDAQPGVYRALLQASELAGLRAFLSFPVG
jgi:hypothetical protein